MCPPPPSAPGIEAVLQALAGQFWGDGHVPAGEEGFRYIRIWVSDCHENGEGESFDEFAARLREQVGDQ